MSIRASWLNSKSMRLTIAGGALVGLAGTALACADVTDYPIWRLAAPAFDDVSRPAIAPGNDTRVNLIWLMRSLRPVSDAGMAYRKPDWDNKELGHTFLTWKVLRATFWPPPEQDDAAESASGTCTPPADAVAAFTAAMAGDGALPAGDRAALAALRGKVGCGTVDWAVPLSSARGREYLAYLQATAAFYDQDWQIARDGFAGLAKARSPWIAETAAYMPIRIALRAALARAVDKYGNYDASGIDAAQVAAARAAIAGYLKAWPHGRYVASAQGLMRRVMWLSGDRAGLAQAYEHLLATTPVDSEEAADLAEEIDLKLLADDKADAMLRQVGDTPLLLAISDLRGMRVQIGEAGPAKPMPLADADLAGQAPAFGAHGDLYGFLRATRAFYAGEAMPGVLAAIPEDLQAPGATPLAFSRQVLRGMAMAKAGDAGEARFWTGLIAGARPLFQRPFAELALAVHWQQAGRLDRVFAAGSPVEDQTTREILLQTIAPPAILRAEATDATRPGHERDIARFTLLYKDLSRQAYADFGRDVALVPGEASTGSIYDFAGDDPVAVGLFTHGKWADGYACPALAVTAATLARDPQDVGARLCLGDFWRLNGFDTFSLIDTDKGADTLGHRPDRFPGMPLRRDAIYAAILADPRVRGDERAYALYRSVMCYAPGGYNECAGPFDTATAMNAASVPKPQRQAWYLELKKRYPASPWAKALHYFW